MGFWVKTRKNHFEVSCDVISDMLFNSLLKEPELEKEKKVIFEEIKMIQDNPQTYVLDLWEKLLYGDQPAGWPIAGTLGSVAGIKRGDLLNHLRNHFIGARAVIVVAGKVYPQESRRKIEKYFKRFPQGAALNIKTVKESQKKPKLLLHFKETDQAHLCLGVRAFDLFSPKRYALAVLAALSGGIMSSRLFIEVREKRALGYYIETSAQHYTDSGYLVTHAGLTLDRLKEGIRTILREYNRLKKNRVPQSELDKAKESIKGRLVLSLETSDAWASFLGSQETLKKEISLPAQEFAKIDKVTVQEIQELAHEIFRNEKLNLAIIGPLRDSRDLEKILNLKSF
jgi:predicted Zn-dependent peptidase